MVFILLILYQQSARLVWIDFYTLAVIDVTGKVVEPRKTHVIYSNYAHPALSEKTSSLWNNQTVRRESGVMSHKDIADVVRPPAQLRKVYFIESAEHNKIRIDYVYVARFIYLWPEEERKYFSSKVDGVCVDSMSMGLYS